LQPEWQPQLGACSMSVVRKSLHPPWGYHHQVGIMDINGQNVVICSDNFVSCVKVETVWNSLKQFETWMSLIETWISRVYESKIEVGSDGQTLCGHAQRDHRTGGLHWKWTGDPETSSTLSTLRVKCCGSQMEMVSVDKCDLLNTISYISHIYIPYISHTHSIHIPYDPWKSYPNLPMNHSTEVKVSAARTRSRVIPRWSSGRTARCRTTTAAGTSTPWNERRNQISPWECYGMGDGWLLNAWKVWFLLDYNGLDTYNWYI
jgi:hypothetical protein